MKLFYLIKGSVKGMLRGSYKSLIANSSFARKYLRESHTAGGNSLYCYGVWMKYLKYWSKFNEELPKVVVEIGPGNSLGAGLAALISGSNTLFSLERMQFCNAETNIRVFDELVTYFKTELKTKSIDPKQITGDNEDHLDFPSHILTKEHLSKCLADERLEAIRKEISNPDDLNNTHIHTIIPWNNSPDVIEDNTVDYIFSHTVLQHLEDLPDGYKTMKKWLKKGGCMAHTIDLRSLNRTKLWNGHWTLSKLEWKIITGGVSLISREPLSTHLKLLKANDFEIKDQISVLSPNTLKVEDLSDDFKHLNDKDLTTSGYFYFAQAK